MKKISCFLFFCFTLFISPVSLFAGQWLQNIAEDWSMGSGTSIDTTTYSGSVALATHTVQISQTTANDWGAGTSVNVDTHTNSGNVILIDYARGKAAGHLSPWGFIDDYVKTTDGDDSTYGFGQAGGIPAGVTVDLGSAHNIGAIRVKYSCESGITAVRLYGANGSWYETEYKDDLPTSTTDRIFVFNGGSKRYWTLVFYGSDAYINVQLFTIELYSIPATFTTQTLDFGYSPAVLSSFTATISTGPGTLIEFFTRTSPDGSSWGNWDAVTSGSNITSMPNRYIQVTSTFAVVGDCSSLPVLQELAVNCIDNASFVSQSHRAFQATNQGYWGTFSAKDDVPPGSSIDYYAVTSTSIYNLSTNSPFPLTNGGPINSTVGPYIQIISSFTRTGASDVPKIDSFTVTWDDCYKLYGHVYYPDGITAFPLATAKIQCGVSSRTCVTDAGGYYELLGSMGSDWTLTIGSNPAAGTMLFDPSSIDYPNLGIDHERDFLRVKGNPVLEWRGVGQFIGDGLDPEVGASTTPYIFNITYKDNENDQAKTGFPKLRIKKSGITVQLISMNKVSGDWVSGMLYSTTTLLSPATDYTYSFEAQDMWDAVATGGATSDTPGPVVKAKISGRLTTYFGAPVVGRKVFLYHDAIGEGFVTTDSNGEFVFPWLRPGDNYRIVPESSTTSYFDVAEVSYTPLIGDATQQFIRTDTIAGTIRDPKGNPLPGIRVSLFGPYNDIAVTDDGGYYSFYVTTETYTISPNHASLLFSPSAYMLSNVNIPTNGYEFLRLSRVPSLLPVGETGYLNDAVEPNNAGPQDTILFKIKYTDQDDDAIKNGCPMIFILRNGATVQTLSMDYSSGSDNINGKVFVASTMLNLVGHYDYCIKATDVFDASAVDYTGTFTVVADIPPVPTNVSSNVGDGSGAVSGRVHLAWGCGNDSSNDLTYTLYLSDPELRFAPGKSPGNLVFKVVYVGKKPDYVLSSLESGKIYYWKVKVENQYGATSESPVYSFSTIEPPAKAFSYPNPFNPAAGQGTNIVFTMPEEGSAQVSVFSEFGDICWKGNFSGLPKGSNQISYDGKDDKGQIMYNGTYVCVIRKKYRGGEATDRCRIMIIK